MKNYYLNKEQASKVTDTKFNSNFVKIEVGLNHVKIYDNKKIVVNDILSTVDAIILQSIIDKKLESFNFENLSFDEQNLKMSIINVIQLMDSQIEFNAIKNMSYRELEIMRDEMIKFYNKKCEVKK